MAAWALGIPITRSRIGEPHCATQIQILMKIVRTISFFFTVKETRRETKHVVAMWTLSQQENVGTGSVYSMRT
jgi:hypothetical protein